jgi:hypothetical protein
MTAMAAPGATRTNDNIERVTALAVDLDGKKTPVDLESFLALMPYRGVAYTTHSSTPDHLRCRVIFPFAAPVDPDTYIALWNWAFEHTGKVMDPACKNLSRIHYLPSAYSADAPGHWIRDLPGPLLDPQSLPLPKTGRERPAVPSGATEAAEMGEASAEALKALLALPLFVWASANPADVAYPVWRGLATNLAALAKDSPELYADCEEAFHEISRNDSRYSPGRCSDVFRKAVQSVESHGPVRWITLAEQGAPVDLCTGHPGAAPAATARIQTRPAPAARSGGRGRGAQSAPEVPPSFVAQKYLFDVPNNLFLIADASGRFTTSAVDGAFNRVLRREGVPAEALDDAKSMIQQIHGKRAFYHTQDVIVEHNGGPHLNTYLPTTLVPAAGNCQPILDLVLHLVGGDPSAQDYVLGWLAAPLQNLHTVGQHYKMETALVLHGDQGSGKGTLSAVMRALYGEENFVELGQDALDSRFNDELESRLFVVCNEVMSGTNRSAETANKLKPWVTDTTIYVERKYEKRKAVDNTFNIIFTSNDERPVIIEASDRRYSVFKACRIDPAITAPIWADLNGPRAMAAAFFDHLLNYQQVPARGQLYHTASKDELAMHSRNSLDRFIDEIKELGWYSVARSWVAAAPRGGERLAALADGSIPVTSITSVYVDYCRQLQMHAKSTAALGRAIVTLTGKQSSRRTHNGIQFRVYEGVPLYGIDAQPLPPPEKIDTATGGMPTSVREFLADIHDLGWLSTASYWVENAPIGITRNAVESDNAVSAAVLMDVYTDYCRRTNQTPATSVHLARGLKTLFDATNGARRYAGNVIKRVYTNIPLQPVGGLLPATPAKPVVEDTSNPNNLEL